MLSGKKLFGKLFKIVAFIYSTIGKCGIYSQLEKFNNDVVKFVNCLSDFFLLLNNVVAILSVSKYQIFVDLMEYASSKNMLLNRSPVLFTLLIWGLRLVVFLPITINIYFLWISIGWNMYKYYLNRDVSYWFHNLVTYTFLTTAMMVEGILSCINEQLRTCSENYIASNRNDEICTIQFSKNFVKPQAYSTTLKMITQMHNTVCDFIETMNQNTKPLLTLVMFCIIGNIFYDCTILIEFGTKPKIIGGIDTKPFIYSMHFFFAAISAAQAVTAAFVGETLEEEGQETTKICFSFLNKLPKDFKTPSDLLIERELNLLLDQSKTKRVCIHAGGFFSINWGILGSIASTVATYSIVIIQFLTK